MNTLPREILSDVTSRLSLTHAASLARTCKEFNQRIWSLITKITLEETNRLDDHQHLHKFHNLVSLALNENFREGALDLPPMTALQVLRLAEIRKEHFLALQSLTNLRKLHLSCVSNRSNAEETAPSLADVLRNHSKLTSFSLSASKVDRLDPLSWSFLTRIQDLTLSERSFNYVSDNTFLEKLWDLTQLRRLSLSHIHLNSMAVGISKLPNLEFLYLFEATSVDPNNHNWIVDYNELVGLSKLTKLAILFSKIAYQTIEATAKLTQLRSLSHMVLDGTTFDLTPYSTLVNLTKIFLTLDGISDLPLKKMPNLEKLQMPWCQAVTQLKHLTNLRDLRLTDGSQDEHNEITFLPDLPWLRKLAISPSILPTECNIDLKDLTSLTYLHLSHSYKKKVSKDFFRCLSTLPALYTLYMSNFQHDYLALLTELPHLRHLILPYTSTFPHSIYNFTIR